MDHGLTFPVEDLQAAYAAAANAWLVVEHRPPGVLRADGASTLEFLQRMSTNEMLDLPPGHVRGTVLTTAIGRSLAAVEVLRRDGGALLVTGHGRAGAVRSWLQRHVFFNDEIEFSEPDPRYRLWSLMGPQAGDEVRRATNAPAPAGEQALEVSDGWLWPRAAPPAGFTVLAGARLHELLAERWGGPGEGTAAWMAYHAHRIERGAASAEDDLDEETIPLEAGLWHLVSFTKGCYIGQEVIARMESRNRLARRLVGARLESRAAAPQEILRGENAFGRLTSVALSPRLGPIGLGIAKVPRPEDLPLEVRLSPSGVGATLVPLPFPTDLA
jgi:aminomethyltransferase